MPIEKIDIENFLQLSETFPVLDVRSPGEYSHAHIPGAISVPIFTDEQRKIIGTAYTQQSRQIAVDHGLGFFSERMKIIPGEAEKLYAPNNGINTNKTFLVHCWRGGMRSGAVAWLLSLYGYQIYLLEGGYKAFRNWALAQFEKEYSLKVLGGFTGSGKTEILKELKEKGENVIDLEKLAHHKGSAFGSLGEEKQPAPEMFENQLAIELWKIDREHNGDGYTKTNIWVEDESAHIGTVGVPKPFWNQMRKSTLYFLDIPFEERLKNIVKNYGVFKKEDLTQCVLKISKRLGGLNSTNAIHFINEGKMSEGFSILLKYYDKMYAESLQKRDHPEALIKKIPCKDTALKNSLHLLEQ
jgi:tRNA 2-selenouridine synthase